MHKIQINRKIIVTFSSLILLSLILYILAIESKKPGILKNYRRSICTINNIKKGIYNDSIIKWCTLPISSRLDQGGIPNGFLDITHPSIAILASPWNGYNIWLAATPYPQSLDDKAEIYENTSVFHANIHNSIIPTTFKAIKHNPIIYNEEAKYNSDPDIFYEKSIMYIISRKCIGPDYNVRIVLQKSQNGENWSSPQTLIKTNRISLCPCLLKVGNIYRIYMFNTHFDERYSKKIGGIITDNIEIWESNSLSHPDFHLTKFAKWHNFSNFWHGDIVLYKKKYYMVYCGTNYNYKILYGIGNIIDTYKYLWLATSDDGYNFKAYPKPILKKSGIYRPTLAINDRGIMTIYFSTENSYYDRTRKYSGGNRIGMFNVSLYDLIKKETI